MLNPKVSVIVPVYNVEAYLDRCLESLVRQTLSDIEIIVVNDGSPDNCQEIVDKYVSLYPDLVFSHVKENGGLSDARNYGLQYARGTFIGFADSDDYVDTAMFEKLYLNATEHNSDIVVCGYFAINEEKGNIQKLQMGNMMHFDTVLAENPKLLYINAPYAWNKLYRRTLFEQSGLRFPKGLIFEDIATVYPLLSLAGKITKVDEPLYYYYLKRKGSITGNFSNKFMQLLQALTLLNEFYIDKKQFFAYQNELLFINLKHIFIRLFEFSLYQDRQFQTAFLKNSFHHLSHYFPDWKSYQYFFDFHYKQYSRRLLTSYVYWIAVIHYPNSLLNLFVKCFRKIKKGCMIFKKKWKQIKTKKSHFRFLYAVFYKYAKVNRYTVLFESFHGSNISDSPYYMMKELIKEKKYKIYFTTNQLPQHKEFLENNGISIHLVELNSIKYQYLLATAKYLINNSSFPQYFIKKEKQVYVNTWHGTPLKTLGKNMIKGIGDMHNIQRNFLQSDYLLFPNKFTMDQIMRDYNLNTLFTGKALLTGYPRNVAFQQKEENTRRLRKQLGLENKTVFAYMPTWRGEKSSALSVNEYARHMNQMFEYMDSKMHAEQYLYVNLHPLLHSHMNLNSYQHVFPFPKYVDNYEFLNICDALITDYSSVFFDFALTQKPIVLFMYDYDEYMKERGVYFDVCSLPFTKIYKLEDMCDYLTRFPQSAEYYADDKMFFYKFLKYESPEVTKTVNDFIFYQNKKEIIIFDYAKNKEYSYRLFMPKIDPCEEDLSQATESRTICMLKNTDFTQSVNDLIYRQYKDIVSLVVISGKIPVTYTERLLLNRRFIAFRKMIDGIYLRELKRILPYLHIADLAVERNSPKMRRVAEALKRKSQKNNRK